MINREESILETMFMVTISINDFTKENYAFRNLDKAKAYFRKRIAEIFAEEETSVDDDGHDVDECTTFHYCIMGDNVHTIDLMG